MQLMKQYFPTILALVASAISTATQGCLNFQNLAGQSISGSLISGNYTRTFEVDFPPNYSNANARGGAPLVVAFHGATRDIAFIKTQTQYSNPSFNPDHVVVYPQGVRNYWQGSPYASSSVDDITFTQQLLTYLSTHYCLDSTRFYASGHSNGGGFCNTIACWPGLSGRFAAFAPNSAAIYVGSRGPNDVCKPDHAITPMLELHGHADPVIPYDGGKVAGGLSSVPPILDWITNWVTRNGCAASSFVSNVPFPEKVTRYNSEACSVRHFAFQNLPHEWATNATTVPAGDFKTPISATLTALAWFRAHT